MPQIKDDVLIAEAWKKAKFPKLTTVTEIETDLYDISVENSFIELLKRFDLVKHFQAGVLISPVYYSFKANYVNAPEIKKGKAYLCFVKRHDHWIIGFKSNNLVGVGPHSAFDQGYVNKALTLFQQLVEMLRERQKSLENPHNLSLDV